MDKGTFRGWIASLSNGETIFEGSEIPGESTPWQKLRARCKEEGLHVTQLRLQLAGLTFIGLPDSIGYCQCWEQQKDLFRGTTRLYRGIGSIIEDKVYLTWIDNNGNIRQDIRDYESMKVHCIVKE